MPAATAARHAALLRHAFLLAAVLAVILGFLGMHVLASSHGTHASAAAAVEGSHAAEHGTRPAGHHPAPPADARSAEHHQADHPAEHPSAAPAAAAGSGTAVPPSCDCQNGCTEQPGAHVDCTPSQAGAALSAPQPGATLVTARPHADGHSDLLPRSTYLPGTPTPGDLSISRT
ncbi:hypothetical protein [Arthrobacter sp. EPSL27]|uniref:hypothetical protein n=1 Tax=Arthrobacter sp. EPSL27 TaxID=1745378 RepID=UPI00074A8432|nr:hypothetical protein [Arthrobacter sp. EPSL27]KUM41260.1 hypothetical protein AR539_01095 [Arthrobacter sp. EPSL27]